MSSISFSFSDLKIGDRVTRRKGSGEEERGVITYLRGDRTADVVINGNSLCPTFSTWCFAGCCITNKTLERRKDVIP